MNSTDRGFSIDWLLGTALTLLILLINPDESGWRMILLVSAGLLFLIAVGKGQWVKRTDPILTLTGAAVADDGDTFSRRLRAYAFVIVGITVFGFVTWPSKPIGLSGDVVLLPGMDTPQIQFHPTPKAIPPIVPGVQPGTEMKEPIGRAIGAPVKVVKPRPVTPGPPRNLTITVQ